MAENFEKQKQSKPPSLNSKEASEIAKQVSKSFEEFKQARSTREKKWNECAKAFMSQHNHEVSDARKWRSQIYVPLSYEAATNIYSNLKRALFPTDSAFFSVEGMTDAARGKANILKTFLLYQLDSMNFVTKFGNFLKQLVITGNSAAAIYWKKTTRLTKETVEEPLYDGDGNITGYETRVQELDRLIYDGPEFETINMFDIVFDPAVTNWSEGLVIHRSYRTYDQVKNNPVYKNTVVLADSNVSRDIGIDSMKAFEMPDSDTDNANLVKLYSAYGDFMVGDKVYYDYIAVVANDEHLIRFEPNPYQDKPFVFCTYESVPNELYGIGAIEPGLGIQYLVNTFSNQKADVLSLIINGMWAYVDDGIIDPEEIIAKPGALIPVKNTDNIRPLHPDNTVALSYNEISQLKAEYQEVTGATKYFTGGPSIDFRKTATEVAALQNAGIVRFSEVIQNVEQNALKRAIDIIFNYNSLFNDELNPVNYNLNPDDEFSSFAEDLFNDDYTFRIVGANSSISRDIRVNKLIEFIQMASSSPVLAQRVNIIELVKNLYRELGFKNEDQIFGVE
ncbi:MAG: portal protein [Cyanobacteriota bacterium]